MTEKILNNNQVVVAGEIVSDFRFSHEIFGEGFYMVDLVVSRLSDAHDVIPLMVSDRLFDVEKSHIGEKVLAKGQFRSYNKHEENKNRLILSVFVREIEVIDAVDDKENKPNQIYLDGTGKPDFPGRIHMQRADLPYDAAWQRDCRYSARCEPGIRKIRLYSLYLLGQKCQICRKARSW